MIRLAEDCRAAYESEHGIRICLVSSRGDTCSNNIAVATRERMCCVFGAATESVLRHRTSRCIGSCLTDSENSGGYSGVWVESKV